MSILTQEKASNYFTAKEAGLDLVNGGNNTWKKVLGFTLTPDPERKGWDNVTYYSKRKRENYFQGDGNYYVYVLSNPTMPGILKIGFTIKHPEERAHEISRSTGVPAPYKVEYAFKCYDGHSLEREIHSELGYCRISNNREHFSITIDEAKKVIQRRGKMYSNDILDL